MGTFAINAYFVAHGGTDTSVPAREFRLHQGTPPVNGSWTLTTTQWNTLRADATGNDKTDFLTHLKAAVGTWTWTAEMEDAAWEAGRRCWT